MESNHGTIMIRGRVFASTTGITNELTPNSTGSSLFYGRDNYLAGTDSFIIAGVHDTITSDVSNSTIVGGTNNILTRGDNIYIIGGSGNEIVTGKNSFIVGGHDNILSGNDSYIIGGSNSIVDANHSFAAGSDIKIDKDYVFAWKDRSDDVVLSPKKENTFTWFAQNGISIGYRETNNTDPGTVDINGGFQVADEKKTCALNIAGAIQYIGGLYGCFCLCNGSNWESLTHSKNCRVSCSHLTGNMGDLGEYAGVCRYKTEGGRTPKIWALAPFQGCDNGLAINFETGFENGKIKGWTRQCVGNKGAPDNCAADATIQDGICSTTSNEGIADYYTKCTSGFPTNIDPRADNKGIIKWTCMGVNSSIKEECKGCENNYVYRDGICKDETGKCNNDYNGKNLSSLIPSVDICYRGTIANYKTGYTEDKRVAGWNWDCVGTGANGPSVAKCKATYRSEPGRCQSTSIKNVKKYGDYVGVAKTASCNKGNLSGVVYYTGAHEMTWICSGVNFDRNAYCWGCDFDSNYNRHIGKCEVKTCDYDNDGGTGMIHTEIDGYGAYVLTTCNRRITIMDKNLGATTSGMNPDSYGYYYQWGNNHGFTPDEAYQKRTQTRIPWSGDYDRKGYSGDDFVMQERNEANDVCTFWNYWVKTSSRDCTVHEDIWGGAMDGFVNWFYNSQWGMDTLYRVHSNDIDDYIEDRLVLSAWNQHINLREYMLNTGAIARRGPCPEGWHVPSLGEWGALVNDWCLLNPDKCKADKGKDKINVANGKSIGSITTSKDIDDRFLAAFKLPRAGRLIPDPEHTELLVSNGSEGFYWSSSTYDAQHLGYAWFYSSSLYPMKANGEMRRGVPVRCFKNPEIIDDTAHNEANK